MLEGMTGGFAIAFITAPGGSGKTYCVVREYVESRLAQWEGHLFTNLPLNVEAICEQLAKTTGRPVEEFESRIHVISKDTLDKWEGGKSGPWTIAEAVGEDGQPLFTLENADFVLDECHKFCPRRDKQRQQRWEKWLGEVRHEKWSRVVFISQDVSKVGEAITCHAEMRYKLSNAERRRDPWFKIMCGDWYELRAAFTGQYLSSFRIDEQRKDIAGRWVSEESRRVANDPFYWAFYNSYEASRAGANGEAPKREFQKRSRLGLVAWFCLRNWWRLGNRLAVASLLIWLGAFGGAAKCIAFYQENGAAWILDRQRARTGAAEAKEDAVSVSKEGKPEGSGGKAAAPGSPPGLVNLSPQERAAYQEWQRSEEARRESEGAIVMLTPEEIYLANGERYAIGDCVLSEPMKGRKLEKINFEKREVVLSGGYVARLGGARVQSASLYTRPQVSTRTDPRTGVHGVIPAGQVGNLPREDLGRVGQNDNAGR